MIVGLASTTHAGPTPDLDVRATRPGATGTRTHGANGVGIIEFRQGRVVIRQEKRRTTVLSTKVIEPAMHPGAIGGNFASCSMAILVAELAELNTCYPHSHDDYRNELYYELDQTTRYFARNYIVPMTLEQGEAMVNLGLGLRANQTASVGRDALRSAFDSGQAKPMARDMLRHSAQEQHKLFEQEFSKLQPEPIAFGCTAL